MWMSAKTIQKFVVRLKFQKQITSKVSIGVLKFVSRTIPHSGGYNTPQLALGSYP